MSQEISKGIYLHKCNRKGCVWTSPNKSPKTCAKCRSPYWNKDRVY